MAAPAVAGSASQARSIRTIADNLEEAVPATFRLHFAERTLFGFLSINFAEVGTAGIQRKAHGFLLCGDAYDVKIGP